MSVRKIFIKTVILSILLCIALASQIIAQDYTTKVVPKNVPSLTLFQTTWLVQETMQLDELTICERAVLKAPEGKYLTMTVNGIGKDIKPGTYKGDIVISVTDNYLMTPHSLNTMNQISRNFHAAIVVQNGKVVRNKCTPAVVYGGEVTDTKTEGIYIASDEKSFNGIIIDGDTRYTINNVKMDLDGFGDNDWLGTGAGLITIDTAQVTINNSEFNMSGVSRCPVHIGGHSVVTFNNCKLFNHSEDTDLIPFFCWQIGFRGSNRLAMLTDYGTVYFNNCHLKTNGWGVGCIDGATKVKMVFKDSTLELSGPRAHGYGVFAIGANEVTLENCILDVNGYPIMLMAMQGGRFDNKPSLINCRIKGKRFGAFLCGDDNSLFTIKDSTFQTDKSTFCIKGSATTVNMDNTKMEAKNGIIVQLMDTEENGMNQQEYRIPVGVVDKAIPGRDLTTASPTEDVHMNISNTEIHGDFLNSTTAIRACKDSPIGSYGPFMSTAIGFGNMIGAAPPEGAAPGGGAPGGAAPGGSAPAEGEGAGGMGGGVAKDLKGPKNLSLNFTKVKVEGVISSATQAYKKGLTVIGPENREELSNVTQTPAEPVNNGVIVSLDKDSVWTVTGTSYITALIIAQGAQVKAPTGKSLTMLVNGKKTGIATGTYKGKIQMVVN